jgi:hypothetical protein
MKRGASWKNRHLWVWLAVGCLAIVTCCSTASADIPVTATLKATPSPTAKPGTVVKFQADVYYNPAFLAKYSKQPGFKMRVWVTRHDFSWISEKLDIDYPGMGSVHVTFTNGFTIPSDAKLDQVFDFYLVWGIWYPISNKASVRVKLPVRLQIQQKEYRKVAPVK